MTTRAAGALTNRLASGADGLRRFVWRLFVRLRIGRGLIADRNTRLAVIASVHMLIALSLTVTLPAWLLLIGPIILGAPHIVADIRYLLIRPIRPISRAAAIGILAPLGLLFALRVLNLFGGPEWLGLEVACGVSALCAGVALAGGRPLRQTALLLAACALAGVAVANPYWASLAMVHLHNLVAVALWIAWSRQQGGARHTIWVGAIFFGCIGLLALGVFEPISTPLLYLGGASGIDTTVLAAAIAPGLAPALAMRVLLIFAFAQAVHYTIWLRLIPGSEPFEPRRGPTTFKRNLSQLRSDLGRIGAQIAIGLVLLVPLCAMADPLTTRDAYFSLVVFHGWLEIAIAAHLLAGKR